MNTDSARNTFDALLRKQEQERADLAAHILAEEERAAARIRAAFNAETGAGIADALDAAEQQLRAARRDGSLRVRIATELPGFLDANFPPLDRDQRAAGVRDVIVVVPRGYGDGHREPLALALIDVSDTIHGPGSRARRDQQIADEMELASEIRRGRQAEDARDRARR